MRRRKKARLDVRRQEDPHDLRPAVARLHAQHRHPVAPPRVRLARHAEGVHDRGEHGEHRPGDDRQPLAAVARVVPGEFRVPQPLRLLQPCVHSCVRAAGRRTGSGQAPQRSGGQRRKRAAKKDGKTAGKNGGESMGNAGRILRAALVQVEPPVLLVQLREGHGAAEAGAGAEDAEGGRAEARAAGAAGGDLDALGEGGDDADEPLLVAEAPEAREGVLSGGRGADGRTGGAEGGGEVESRRAGRRSGVGRGVGRWRGAGRRATEFPSSSLALSSRAFSTSSLALPKRTPRSVCAGGAKAGRGCSDWARPTGRHERRHRPPPAGAGAGCGLRGRFRGNSAPRTRRGWCCSPRRCPG